MDNYLLGYKLSLYITLTELILVVVSVPCTSSVTCTSSVSVQSFSRSVMSDSLKPHKLHHARPLCPSPTPTQTHVHLVGDAIQPSHPLLSPSPPSLNLSQHQGLFQ